MMFNTLLELVDYLQQYSRARGFNVRQLNHDDNKAHNVKGTFHCWCYRPPRITPTGIVARTHGCIMRTRAS